MTPQASLMTNIRMVQDSMRRILDNVDPTIIGNHEYIEKQIAKSLGWLLEAKRIVSEDAALSEADIIGEQNS